MSLKNVKKYIGERKVGVLGTLGVALVGGAILFATVPTSQDKTNYNNPTELKTAQKKLDKVADQEVVAINKRLTNDQLSELSAQDILGKYNKKAQESIAKLFSGQDSSRDYALTLIGKVIPSTSIKLLSGDTVSINKKTAIVILNTGDKSKSFVEQLNKVSKESGVTYLAIFPSETNERVQTFIDETKLDQNKFKVATLADNPKTSTQPDLLGIAEYYFNAKGAPSYVSIESNSITFAGSGNSPEMFKTFLENSFKKPYLYNEIQ